MTRAEGPLTSARPNGGSSRRYTPTPSPFRKRSGSSAVPAKFITPGLSFSSNEIRRAVGSILDSAETGQFVAGRKVAEFEAGLATYIGTKYANVVNSGSSADLLALASLADRHLERPMKVGDEVVTSVLNFSTLLTRSSRTE